MITSRVKKGTKIITHCFVPYRTLRDFGYSYLTVNHSEHFVDPLAGVCMSKMESKWWAITCAPPSLHTHHTHFALRLVECMWRKTKKEMLWRRFYRALERHSGVPRPRCLMNKCLPTEKQDNIQCGGSLPLFAFLANILN